MHTSASFVRLAITTAIIFFRALPFSTAVTNANYSFCSNLYSCGSIENIEYPFWGGGRRDFCGHPEFHLNCVDVDNTTRINIPSMGYAQVVNISPSSHIMSIVPTRFVQSPPFCLPHNNQNQSTNTRQNSHLSAAFKIFPNVINVTLFYGCNQSILRNHPHKSFDCLSDDYKNGSVSYFSEMSGVIKQETMKSCRNYSAMVLKNELGELYNGKEDLLGVLRKGIELEYVVNFTACSACQNSGGNCGSSSSKFVCYCPHGPQLLRCLPQDKSYLKKALLVLVTAASALAIILFIVLIIYSRRRRSVNKSKFLGIKGKMENQNVEAFLKSYGSLAPKRYTYTNIKKMTYSFKDKLGEGGYGHVYKGKLHDGRTVAVKVLKKVNDNGEEFINEVVSISRTNHINVVTLLGFSFEGKRRALVYEFLPNGSLEKFIHGARSGQTLPCETLFSISVGIARGLDYLHRGCNTRILHFDIKPHNILLDEKFSPKISDFGLARLFPKEQSHISSFEARGTIGYIAPEVFCRNFGGVSHKSDVYSFGMMIIDMICGRNNASAETQCSSELYFPEWIYNQLQVEETSARQGIADEENNLKRKMILVGLWCIQTYPSNRPSMNKVVEMLEGSLESLQVPPKPDLSSPPISASCSPETSQST